MYSGLASAIIIVALLVGGWCFVAVARDRWLDRTHLAGLAVLELVLLVQAVAALIRIAGGERPEEFVTFLGYLATAVLLVPAAVLLAFMERTRWGSVIAGSACVVVAVLGLRLLQVWTPLQ
ncbi:MAG TPA: hypothetical protein VF163_06820 [Micromonosporaceae bacterium]